MIKLLICDGDGTLGFPNPPSEVRALVSALPSLGIQLAVASNSPKHAIISRFSVAGIPAPGIVVTPPDVHIRKPGVKNMKPSPAFVQVIQEMAGVELPEIVYLGDDDLTDSFCAINAGVLPFVATYSKSGKPMEYGLPVTSPTAFLEYLSTLGKQAAPYFGWEFDGASKCTGANVDMRAVLGDHSGLTPVLDDVLKKQLNPTIGTKGRTARSLLFHYLLTQCYLSGLASRIDMFTVYPGHEAGSTNPLLQEFSRLIAVTFRDKSVSDLLVRHTTAPKSQYQGSRRNIHDQFRTVNVNPKYRAQIQGKRILVLDDFTTRGFSLETARQMLLAAGAIGVVGVAIAKFRHDQVEARTRQEWNPFVPCTLGKDDIEVEFHAGTFNPAADAYFHNVIWPVYNA